MTQFSDVVVVSITGRADRDVLSDLPAKNNFSAGEDFQFSNAFVAKDKGNFKGKEVTSV